MMLAITHFLVVILLVYLLKLDRNEILAVMLFGVFIDVDHLLAIPDFVSQNGVSNLTNTESLLNADVQWKSALHSPMAILVVAPAAVAFRLALPLVAWGTHVAMDTIQIEYLGIASLAEILLLGILILAFALLEFRRFVMERQISELSPPGFPFWELRRVSGILARLTPRRRHKPAGAA